MKKMYFFMILSLSQNFFWEIASKGVFGLLKSAGCYTIYGYQSFAGTAARP